MRYFWGLSTVLFYAYYQFIGLFWHKALRHATSEHMQSIRDMSYDNTFSFQVEGIFSLSTLLILLALYLKRKLALVLLLSITAITFGMNFLTNLDSLETSRLYWSSYQVVTTVSLVMIFYIFSTQRDSEIKFFTGVFFGLLTICYFKSAIYVKLMAAHFERVPLLTAGNMYMLSAIVFGLLCWPFLKATSVDDESNTKTTKLTPIDRWVYLTVLGAFFFSVMRFEDLFKFTSPFLNGYKTIDTSWFIGFVLGGSLVLYHGFSMLNAQEIQQKIQAHGTLIFAGVFTFILGAVWVSTAFDIPYVDTTMWQVKRVLLGFVILTASYYFCRSYQGKDLLKRLCILSILPMVYGFFKIILSFVVISIFADAEDSVDQKFFIQSFVFLLVAFSALGCGALCLKKSKQKAV